MGARFHQYKVTRRPRLTQQLGFSLAVLRPGSNPSQIYQKTIDRLGYRLWIIQVQMMGTQKLYNIDV